MNTQPKSKRAGNVLRRLVKLIQSGPAILVAMLMMSTSAMGQAFTALHHLNFNTEGSGPLGKVVISAGKIYGTAVLGGSHNDGTVFSLNTNGSGFTVLHAFSGSDGIEIIDGLTISGATLYGGAYWGGNAQNWGTLFKINTDGSGFSVLHTFGTGEGHNPAGPLVLSGTNLYGTTFYGGANNYGTVFKINIDGTGYTTLYDFTSSDSHPVSGVILSGTTLYGTTSGDSGVHPGIIFKLQTDGSGFTTLHTFDANYGSDAGLLLAGSVLYGTTTYGGSSGCGTVFKMNVNGTGFTTLHSFSNSGTDGSVPVAPLLLIGNILYGTTGQGGNYGTGTIFRLNTDGTHFAVIYRQDPIVDVGYHPAYGGLAVSDNRIYGVMENDDSGPGSVFVSGPKLVNVQFGDAANPYIKTGLEAVGFTEGDFWNFATYDSKDGGGFLLKSAPDAIGLTSPVFVFADQDVGTQSLSISSDNLFNGFAYPGFGGDLLIEIDLPAGVFDIYVFNGSGTSTTFTLYRDGIQMGSGSTSSGYVEFSDVHSGSPQTLILNCSGTAPICNGLQIVFYQ